MKKKENISKRFFNIDSLNATILVFLIMAAFPLLFSFKVLEPVKNSLVDYRFTDIALSRLREPADVKSFDNLTIVNTMIENLGESESPGTIAMALRIVESHNPKVIAFAKTYDAAPGDEELFPVFAALADAKSVVLASEAEEYDPVSETFYKEKRIFPDSPENVSYGFSNLLFGQSRENTTVRETRAAVEVGDETAYSFAYQTAKKYDPERAEVFLRKSKNPITIFYRGNAHKFATVTVKDIFDDNYNPSLFENKIVMFDDFIMPPRQILDVENDMKGMKQVPHNLDLMYFTPLNPQTAGRMYPNMYGAEIQANIISMILTGDYYIRAPRIVSFAIAAIICYLNTLLFYYVTFRLRRAYELISLGVFVVESLIILFVLVILYNNYMIEINLTAALLALALSVMIFEVYRDSLKPLTLEFIYRLKTRISKRRPR